MSDSAFWKNEPVQNDISDKDGEIMSLKPTVKLTPLPEGLEWGQIDPDISEQIESLYQLLRDHYVSSETNRLTYSIDFLHHHLRSPRMDLYLSLALWETESKKLVGYICGTPMTLVVREKEIKIIETNLLCLIKSLRDKGLAPLIIKEITRRAGIIGISQSMFTGNRPQFQPVSTARYYHRIIDYTKAMKVDFCPVVEGNKLTLYQMYFHVQPVKNKLRLLEPDDIPLVTYLLNKWLSQYQLYQKLDEEYVRYMLLDNSDVDCWIFEENGNIDIISVYYIDSTHIPTGNSIKEAYLYYHTAHKVSVCHLFQMLLQRLSGKVEVVNILDIMDKANIISEQSLKIVPGTGTLNYYLYNWATAPISSAENGKPIL